MTQPNRRRFLASAATLGAAGLVPACASDASAHKVPPLVHHVFFWLKNPDSEQDRQQLIAGLKTLADIPTVRGIHIGVPASTEKREVVDNSFHVSEILYFDDVAGQDAYQVHPIHQAFVEQRAHLWEKVVVYDAIAVD